MTTPAQVVTRGTVILGGETVYFEAGRMPNVGDKVVVIDRDGHLVVAEHLGSFTGAAANPGLTHVRLAGSAANVRDIVPFVGIIALRTGISS